MKFFGRHAPRGDVPSRSAARFSQATDPKLVARNLPNPNYSQTLVSLPLCTSMLCSVRTFVQRRAYSGGSRPKLGLRAKSGRDMPTGADPSARGCGKSCAEWVELAASQPTLPNYTIRRTEIYVEILSGLWATERCVFRPPRWKECSASGCA